MALIYVQYRAIFMRVTYMGAAGSSHFLSSCRLNIPLYIDLVAAGFPSPAQDFVERTLMPKQA